jgi:ATP-dependent protease ClpP protease subunit
MPRIKLSGTVVSNDSAAIYRYFGFQVIAPRDVSHAVDECPEDEELVLEINSGGGSVYAGFEIYNILRSCSRKTKAEVFSIAASAASIIAVACDTVLMSPVSNMMIHRSALRRASGNAEAMEQAAQMLNTIDETMLNAYEEKAGDKSSRTKLRHMIENETFLTAEEAVNCGLADGILERKNAEEDSDPMDAVASATGGGISIKSAAALFAGQMLPPVDDLRRMMAEQKKLNNDTEPEQPAPESVQNNSEKEGQKVAEENKVIQDAAELMKAYPGLTNEIREEAAQAERKRIESIDALALPGFEEIISKAKKDGTQTAGSVAMAIIMAQKEKGQTYLDKAKDDAEAANSVNSEAAPEAEGKETEQSDEEMAKAALKLLDMLNE